MSRKILEDGSILVRRGNKILKTKTVEETIDRGDLEIEKRGIEEELKSVLSDKELLAWAKENYPGHNLDAKALKERLNEINDLLEV